MKPLRLGFVAICLSTGCGRSLGLGTDVVWSTGFESGDLSDWPAPVETDAGGSDPSVTVSTAQAHTGSYSAKLSSIASAPQGSPYEPGGGCLYQRAAFPESAYYSAWYLLPSFYETLSAWSILKFMIPVAAAPSEDAGDGGPSSSGTPSTALGRALDASELFDLSVLSLPGQTMTLVLFDARHQYLESPLPDPVPHLPVGTWFQIEAFFRHDDAGAGGELTIWLDGTLIYDVVRPTGGQSETIFAVCSLANDLSPQDVTLYVDDVAVSWTRVTPGGVLSASP